ncbi:dihydrofolate reductase, partial [Staphylococcus saprophyticus]|uniref:dihydrofolate reductase n=1 Tax=Staphylococcus saprophyticus TaxID=29385 RepID=UPI001CD9ED41
MPLNNQFPSHLPTHLNHLNSLTTPNTLLIAPPTFQSIPKPLPNTRNLLLTTNKSFKPHPLHLIHSFQQIYHLPPHLFIFPPHSLFQQIIHKLHDIYITLIQHKYNADTFFPPCTF